MTDGNRADWAREYLAASQVTDMAKDPDDFRVTRQSKATISGLLMPVSEADRERLEDLFSAYVTAFDYYLQGNQGNARQFDRLSVTMRVLLRRAAYRSKAKVGGFDYVSLDPRDYTLFTCLHVAVPVVCIHTRPERCWFLGILRFEGALGLSLGRMRVMRPNDKGMYPVTIRTKWRALTNKVKQEEVRDAYRRLIKG